jgi:heme A synthase
MALLAGVLYITQAIVGAANIWTTLADGVVIAHLSLAALLWCVMVWLSASAFYYAGREMAEAGAEADTDTAGRKVTGWAR